MTQSQLTFPSVTPLLTWAGVNMIHRLGDSVYVEKEGLFYYFGDYPDGYHLLMTSLHDLLGD